MPMPLKIVFFLVVAKVMSSCNNFLGVNGGLFSTGEIGVQGQWPTNACTRTPASLRLAPQVCGVAGQASWILTATLAFFVALGFVRFVGESRPSSRRYPAPLRFGDFPLTGTMLRAVRLSTA
jgi:hypothetical protein